MGGALVTAGGMAATSAGLMALSLFVLCYGMNQWSAGIVMAARAADLFQGRSFGRIDGWISVASGIGDGLGAWLAGAVFDCTGSYYPAFSIAAVALAVGASALRATYQKGISIEAPDQT